MAELPISFEAWLAKFSDQMLASNLQSLLNNEYVSTPEAFIHACITAYYEAQIAYNQNPEKRQTVELLTPPVVSSMISKGLGIQSQKTTYSLQFETEYAVEIKSVGGLTKPKV